MRVGGKSRRLILLVLLGALPFFLSQCARKQPVAVRALTPKETAKLAETHDPWRDTKPRVPSEKSALAEDRLEALGELALENRDFESSLINFLQILKDNPSRYDLHYKVGVIFLMTGELDAAKKELALVLVHKPDMLKAHEALGLVHLQEKKYPQAIEEFQIVLSQEPQQAKTRHLLGVTFLEAGQYEKAISELKKAAQLDPKQLSTLIALGQAYNQVKDYRNAVSVLKKGQALSPENQKLYYQLGMAYAGLKQYSEALEAFLKAGDEAQAYNNIGVYYFVDGRYEEAARCFQRAIELRPTLYQEAKGNLQRALEKLQQGRNDGS